jgi:hypothetical protein
MSPPQFIELAGLLPVTKNFWAGAVLFETGSGDSWILFAKLRYCCNGVDVFVGVVRCFC